MANSTSPSTELSIAQYIHILRARKWLLIFSLVGAASLALMYSLQLPDTYTARTYLHFDMQTSNPFFGPGQTRDAEYLRTQMDIMKTQHVAEKVIEGLSDEDIAPLQASLEAELSPLDRAMRGVRRAVTSLFEASDDAAVGAGSNPVIPAQGSSARPHWLSSAIRRGLEVEPMFGSRIVEVAYTTADPRVAARLANEYANGYIRTSLEMVTSPAKRTQAWFDAQMQDLRKKLEEAQQRLTAFQQTQGIVATEERVDTESKVLTDLSNQVVTAEAQTRQLRLTVQQLERAIADGQSVLTAQVVFENGIVQRVSADLRELEAKQAELSARLGINHPQYQRTVVEVQEARNKLNDAVNSVVSSVRSSVALSQETENRVKEAFATQKQLVLSLKGQHDQIAVLQRDVDSAAAIYNTALTQFNQTNLQAVVDQTNVSVVDAASVPSSPSGPDVLKNLVLAVFAGGVLGVGLIVLFELLDRRVRSKDDIIGTLDIPLLGVLGKA